MKGDRVEGVIASGEGTRPDQLTASRPRQPSAEPQGRPVPSPGPEAELWMGAHPSAPSGVLGLGQRPATLDAVIAADPERELGPRCVARFGPRLPFLLKVLAAEKALSIQVHPS